MKLIININMDNEAFDQDNVLEVARILKDYTNKICRDGDLAKGDKETLLDSNGNTVGTACVK